MERKPYKELDPSVMTAEEKLGLLLCAQLNHGEKDLEYTLTMIRERRLGAMWVPFHQKNRADYANNQAQLVLPANEDCVQKT